MAAYPIRMHRSGRMRLVAVVMVLLALAAGVLFSAGSEHHRHVHRGGPAHRVAAADQLCPPPAGHEHVHPVGEAPAHGHEHGNEWTPNLTPRVRLDGGAALTGVFVGHTSPGDRCVPRTIVAAHDADLSLLGVLRV